MTDSTTPRPKPQPPKKPLEARPVEAKKTPEKKHRPKKETYIFNTGQVVEVGPPKEKKPFVLNPHLTTKPFAGLKNLIK